MSNIKFFIFSLSLLSTILLTSCDDDDETPISNGAQVTVTNTLQTAADPSMGGTGGAETPIELILGVPSGSLALNATVGDGVEYSDYLDGLYDIDLSEKELTFTLVAPSDHPFYGPFFRTIEAGTFDRYYFKFTNDQNVKSGTSSNASVSLSVLSNDEILVTVSEGFSFQPGSTFTITLK